MSQTPALLLTGATGLIGQALSARRAVVPLPRRAPVGGSPWWEPRAGAIHDAPEQVGAVVHLAGAPVAGSRWTEARKDAIMESRRLGTRTLVDWISARQQRPSVLVSASAIGIYGDRGDEVLDEASGRGSGFLADVVSVWEEEAERAALLGVRLVVLRIGIVLSPDGGALSEMLPVFRTGLGGPLGSGRQWFPWIHIEDVVDIIERAIQDPTTEGPYNLVAPGIVRQREFAKALGRTLKRPALIPAPRLALRALFGEMADEALLSSAKVVPRRLQEAGYTFKHPALEPALADLLPR
jgi:uncharacterized protein (TIGR01777 family)